MSLRNAGIEDADGDILTFGPRESADELSRQGCLFDVRPPNEEGRRVLGSSQFGDGIAIHKQACKSDFVTENQTNFALWEHESLLLDRDFETTSNSVKCLGMTLPDPNLPPDLLPVGGEQRRIVRKQR